MRSSGVGLARGGRGSGCPASARVGGLGGARGFSLWAGVGGVGWVRLSAWAVGEVRPLAYDDASLTTNFNIVETISIENIGAAWDYNSSGIRKKQRAISVVIAFVSSVHGS